MRFRLIGKYFVISVLVILFASPVGAEGITKEQGDAILKELKHILKELKHIRKELEEIKKGSLRAPRRGPARPVTAKIETKDSPVLGDPEAPITLVEFTDYQCPFCRKFYTNTLSEIKKQYIDTGKVRLVLRDLPLGFHAKARPAAKATHCAREQGKYWEMHDALFEGGGKLNSEDFTRYAEKIGVEDFSFQECMASDRHKEAIDRDIADAGKASINGTPGFVLGKTTENEIEGALISGAQSFASFKRQIDNLLAKLKIPSKAN
jgi:protein-disulfide isomerase